MRPKQAQSDSLKTIDSQLPRKEQKGTEYLEALLRKLNNQESVTDEVLEDQLDSDGLYTHRGEMEESYADQLNVNGKDPINYRDELNKDKAEPKESIIQQLDKTASKKELNQEQILGETRKKNIVDVPMDKQLEDTRQNKKITVNIETLLNDEDEDSFGHQFSDDDLKKFANELGLDYVMESKREEYDDVV
jgi:Rps23 Pro-64 3,4-dihydroxylase Tpa1-like proline 4-hydroxylase